MGVLQYAHSQNGGRVEKRQSDGGRGTFLPLLLDQEEEWNEEMFHCWPRQERVTGHLENESQAVINVLENHNELPMLEPVFFSRFAELQPTSLSIELPWFLLDLQDTKPQMSVEAGGFAARKPDASAGSESSILQTSEFIYLLLKLWGR